WYFAEGATHSGFQLFYLLQNPNDHPVDVTMTYMRTFPLPPLVRRHRVEAGRRQTIWVNFDEIDPTTPPAGAETSVVITATAPIVAERAMYAAGTAPFEAGHGAAGVTTPSATWAFAEGATGHWVDMFLPLANPNDLEATEAVTDARPVSASAPLSWTTATQTPRTNSVDQHVADHG